MGIKDVHKHGRCERKVCAQCQGFGFFSCKHTCLTNTTEYIQPHYLWIKTLTGPNLSNMIQNVRSSENNLSSSIKPQKKWHYGLLLCWHRALINWVLLMEAKQQGHCCSVKSTSRRQPGQAGWGRCSVHRSTWHRSSHHWLVAVGLPRDQHRMLAGLPLELDLVQEKNDLKHHEDISHETYK